MNGSVLPNTMIKTKEIENNNIHYRKANWYIQSNENNSKDGCNSSLNHMPKKEKMNIIRSCNIVNKILKLIFPS